MRHKLYENIRCTASVGAIGKGGNLLGATRCARASTMLFLHTPLMKSVEFGSQTIVLITAARSGRPLAGSSPTPKN